MITSRAFAGKKYAVLGLARSGAAATEALLASGAEVLAWDRQEEPRAAFAGRCALADPLDADLSGFAGVVVSPGVPLNTHPIVAHAARFGVPVIGDIELFAQARASLPRHKVVGITGTNGKSTTTALVAHILQCAGIPALMGGNIGIPILEQQPLPAGGVYVLELSSYQIDLTHSLDCEVAVLLNVTPDHLDRYDGFAEYRASKLRLLEMQGPDHVAIVASGENGVEECVRAMTTGARSKQWFAGNYLTDFASEQPGWPALQGPHNAQNAWAARMVCLALGLDRDQINRGLATYSSLPHRMERVTEHDGVLFINDSKATNTASTAPALAAWPPMPSIHGSAPRIHWILGGLAKEEGLGECMKHLGNVAAAYTIGEAGPRFAELLEPHVPVARAEMLNEAVQVAMEHAQPGDVVLLSPACASFDQFRDFERRGECFRQIVGALTGGSDDDRKALARGCPQ
ncbi:MAG: UDP-N-acetylmuramoyl-L-alanine--D-glutamate ligase [Erythrobacter sp.]|nr:UDP-N-acetylmuramoyl-L-alanine--D-glutamate ligase [Erythrobacter sp.]